MSDEIAVELRPSHRFRRGQVEMALWQHFSLAGVNDPVRATVPPIFRNRIKRLLELDGEDGRPVFINDGGGSRGADVSYARFNVFLLALALDFLDAGFKQSDALHLIRHGHLELWEQWHHILAVAPVLGARLTAQERPKAPLHPNGRHADTSVFLLVRKSEIREAWNDDALPDPAIVGPHFSHGLKQLMNELARLNHRNRGTIVLEISEIAASLNTHLDRAPTVRRGRKPHGSDAVRLQNV